MRAILTAVAICAFRVSLAAQPSARSQPLPQPDVDREEALFTRAKGARYMENASCTDTTYEGWSGYPLKRCAYSVRDRVQGEKRAVVILLDPSPRQLARWVVSACLEVKRTSASSCTSRIRQAIIAQSGAQFPVAGIVLEDMEASGVQKLYVFRDGVTSTVEGLRNGSDEAITDEHIRKSLTGRVVASGRYARIVSTSREDYAANGGTEDVGTSSQRKLRWLTVVRQLYQQAWGSDRNELIVAWARAHL